MSTGKKILLLMIVVAVIEIMILIAFGGCSENATSEAEVWFKAGPIAVYKYGMDIGNIQDVPRWQIADGPFWALNRDTTVFMIIIDIILLGLAWLATRRLLNVPDRLQGAFELILSVFKDLCDQALGEYGKRHFPMIMALFMFLLVSNTIGSLPRGVEPSRDLNVPLGHMIVVLIIVHTEAIRVKGVGTYIKSYFEPFPIMAPLNIVGEIAKGISLAFRLFGNILGGAIIVMVISYLAKWIIVPVGLNMFFSLFVGTIQAFVFTMLSMTYIAVAIAD